MMLSRVADSLFWMSRYLERAEHIARVVNVNLNLTLDRAPADAARHWGRLLDQPARRRRRGRRGRPLDAARARHRRPRQPRVDRRLRRRRARERAPGARGDQLRDVGGDQPAVSSTVQRAGRRRRTGPPARTSSSPPTIGGVHLFQGVTDATMTHGEGWHFMELGRYPRARPARRRRCSTCSIASASGAPTRRPASASTSSGSGCSSRAARSRPTAATTPPTSGRGASPSSWCCNADFPRSIHFAAGRIQASLRALGGADRPRSTAAPSGWPAGCCASLDYGQMDEIIGELPGVPAGHRPPGAPDQRRRPPAVHRLSDRQAIWPA